MVPVTELATTGTQSLVVVNGNDEALETLHPLLEGRGYDVVFADAGDDAYRRIRAVLPNLVILCARIEQLEDFQLLTMLRLDSATSEIPILTCVTEYEGTPSNDIASSVDSTETGMFPTQPAARQMN
jgi:CheY-like chemotaxis protein